MPKPADAGEMVSRGCTMRQHTGGVTVGWITTEQAAAIMGVEVSMVRWLAKWGEIKAQKFGRVWQIDEKSAKAWKRG